MRGFLNEHYAVWGSHLRMPLIQHCGYNEWQVAERLSWHAHEGYELVLLLDGRATFEFSDGTRCELAGGEFFFKLPGQVHRALDDVTSPCKMCWVVFNPEVADASLNTALTNLELKFLVERYCEDERKVFAYSPATKPLLDSFRQAVVGLHSDYRHGNSAAGPPEPQPKSATSSFALAQPPQVALMRLTLCLMLLETARQAQNGPPPQAGDFVAAAIAYMEKRYCDHISVDEVADHLGLSRSYLYTVFRKGTGQTPNDYLQRTRIRAAEAMLAQGSRSVTEIASSLGFSSSQYFSKVFHKYTRQTPLEYRKAQLVRPR
jgi:AraC-like DNA-binding protein